ncbi:hypothetical protein SMC26_34345 [Actinomadura fulvescens]|uniref:Uncharacterized protein n=1 Tax=Actinomadura fulvescens TaxID=46160 RepID=A0ABP6D552_9ACTN
MGRAIAGALDDAGLAPEQIGVVLVDGRPDLDVACALLIMRHGLIPGVPYQPDLPPAYDLDLVTGEPRPADVRHALVIARGHGGFNAALVVSTVKREAR